MNSSNSTDQQASLGSASDDVTAMEGDENEGSESAESDVVAGGDRENGETDDQCLYMTKMSSVQRYSEKYIMDFFHAAAVGDENIILDYLENDFIVNSIQDYDGFDGKVSALMLAARNGHTDCVKLLLHFGADISRVTQHYTKAMIFMSRQSMCGTVKFRALAGAGMYRDRCDHENQTMCYYQKLIDCCVPCQDFGKVSILLSEFSQLISDDEQWVNTLCFLILSGCPKSHIENMIQNFRVDVNGYNSRGFTALISAIIVGDLEIMDLLIREGADVNRKEDVRRVKDLECHWVNSLLDLDENDGDVDRALSHACMLNCNEKSPLTFAIWTRNLKVVRHLLVASDINTDSSDSKGHNALVHAIYSGSLDITKELMLYRLDIGDDHKFDNDNSDLYLLHAVKAGFADITKCLLNGGVNKNAVDDNGGSVLMYLAECGDANTLNLLLDHGGFNIDYFNSQSALMLAAENKHFHCLKLLIDHGADLSENSNDGHSALEYAAKVSDESCVELLLKSQVCDSELESTAEKALHFAARNENSEVLKLILRHCKNVNKFDTLDTTPLMCAAAVGCVENINLLLNYGADVNIENIDGMTAIWQTVACEHLRSFELLIRAGANISCKSEGYGPLLLQAAKIKDIAFLEILLQQGTVHINSLFYTSGFTPLIMAVEYKRLGNVTLLLKYGADVNLPDCLGLMPIVHAIKCLWSEGLHVLLQAGADINAVDENGKALFFYALESWECLKVLLEEGSIGKYDGTSEGKRLIIYHTDLLFDYHYYWDVKSLMLLHEYGVFCWDWYPTRSLSKCLEKLAFAAVNVANCSPTLFEDGNGRMTSLLQEAFLNNKSQTVRYLLSNLFLTMEDYRILISDQDFQQKMRKLEEKGEGCETVSIFNCVSCQPLRLETLCFLTISSSLSTSLISSLPSSVSFSVRQNPLAPSVYRSGPSRLEQVDFLPLPEVFKSRLKFESIIGKLCPNHWASIDWQDDGILAVLKPLYPFKEDLNECEEDCLQCHGCGYTIQESSLE